MLGHEPDFPGFIQHDQHRFTLSLDLCFAPGTLNISLWFSVGHRDRLLSLYVLGWHFFFFNLYEKISSRKMWSEPRSKQSHFDLVGWWMILCLCMSCKNQELVWGGSMAMPSPFFMLAWCNYLLVKCIVLFIYLKIPGREPHTAFCQSKYNNGFQCQIFLDLNFNSDFLALWPWANYLISLNLGVLICESDTVHAS